ncbi:FAD-binding oxidoreductase [Sphingomonas sp.]|uniref:FAD-binding oxidoreductase n=1 Tax=Sphingomonas sp. TaxID=28214 RepID=UPI0031CF46D1
MSLDAFRKQIGDIRHSDEPSLIRRMSRDMTGGFSPILKAEGKGKLAELVVIPESREEVIAVAAAAARHRIAVLPRGAGTCNWGQGIPLAGGIVMDMRRLTRILSMDAGRVRAEPGILLGDLDRQTKEAVGAELRIHPSSRSIATLGGFIAGGHVGMGSCTWGILHDRGNIAGLEMVSVTEEPEIVELRGEDVNFVHHSYGTTGIITAVEMPLAPAFAWREAVVDFEDFAQATRFGITLGQSDGILLKMVSINAWPYPSYFDGLVRHLREGRHTVHVMVADNGYEAFADLAMRMDGTVVYSGLEGQGDFGKPLYEYSFAHARWHANKHDPRTVANIGIFPHDDLVGSVVRVYEKFRDLGPLRLDMKRINGQLTVQGAPIFPYRDADHLASVVKGLEDEGVRSANTHSMHVKENGMKAISAGEAAFRRRMDPYGLCNPGKVEALPGSDTILPTSGWHTDTAAA